MNYTIINKATVKVAGAVALVMQAQVAIAQERPVAQTPPGSDDIVVTAQRRDQRLQDVPIAVAVMSPQTTKTYDVTTTQDIQKAVPGLVFVHRNLNALPFIRGIGSENTAGGDETGIALYVDGVYRASSNSGTFSLPDIERIEVLKGPQGTLFGRNATGGVINIVSKQPSMDPAATVSAGYANYDMFTGSTYVTGPIGGNIAASMSARYQKRADGWGKNVGTGNDVYTMKSTAVTSAVRLDLDDTTITLRGDWSRDVFHGGPGQPTATLPGQGNSFNGVAYFAGFYNVNSDIDTVLRLENYGGSLTVEHDFGGLQFRSISAYRKAHSFVFGESDSIPLFLLHFTAEIKDSIFTQEAHLLSSPGSKIEWIVGGFYLHSKPRLGPSDLILPTGTFSTFNNLKTVSLALFGQATYPLGDDTNITVGGRYTIDEKNYTNIASSGVVTVLPEKTYKSPTWRLAFDHKFDEDIMAYASYNRGFKSGLYGTGTTAPAVRPATVDAYEAGLKTQLLDRRVTLNLAAFYSKYKNIQISSTVINANAGTSFIQLQNAASARTKGLEADLVVRPVNDLRLTASVSLLDAKYTDFRNAPGFVFAPNNRGLLRTIFDASGRTMNGAPSLSYTLSASYVVHSGIGDIRLEASDSYTSKYWFSVDHLQPSQARHLVGASVDWTSPDERWNVRLWGSNLLKERYYDVVVARTSQLAATTGAPRTYGITATANFR